jgi:tribbles-like protein
MKKLEAYYIIQDYASIYNYKELIFDSSDPKNDSKGFVYAIFEPHFGDLHLYMKEKKRLNETEAKSVFKQCVEAVNDCHQNGIIVRDIKLKKFVFLNAERYE